MKRDLVAIAEGRPTCFRCFRPTQLCLCNLVPPFRAHCDVLMLQHPHERGKYYSTAKIIQSVITNFELQRGVAFSAEQVNGFLRGRQPVILYPGPEAAACEDTELGEQHVLIVLDGTWSEAGKVFRRSQLLSTFPRLSFRSAFVSRYEIRRQPKLHCLSSLESLAYALRLTAPRNMRNSPVEQYENLLMAFDLMIERQMRFLPRFSNQARHRKRKPRPA
ncbi:MAG: DTW domain-containing protein [Oligoflexia bacterium]|nr:DTW domain-containing protein [Oligoflexia bacterium]